MKIKNIKLIIISILISAIVALSVVLLFVQFSHYDIVFGLATCFLGILIPILFNAIQDITDTMPWQMNLRGMIRSHQINSDTEIRNSYAYGFRIKVDDKYLLVPNSHGFKYFQIPSLTYLLSYKEKNMFQNKFKARDDDKIKQNRVSSDCRLYVKARYMKNFYKEFNKLNLKNQINEGFAQLFLKTNILDGEIFKDLELKYSKRVLTKIRWSIPMQCWEFLIMDIYDLVLSEPQLNYLKEKINVETNAFTFRDEKEIKSLGVNIEKGKYYTDISQHSVYLLYDISKSYDLTEVFPKTN